MSNLTPMAKQYWKFKNMVGPDTLLAFRLGDFYEFFYDDAITVSEALGIVLTGREMGKGNRVPMAGIPYHSLDQRLKVLMEKGYKVAICEQVEDPKKAKGLVRRDIVKIYTPGTYADEDQVEHTWLLVLEDRGDQIGYYLVDATTLDFVSFFLPIHMPIQDVIGYLSPYSPKEILVPTNLVGSPLVSELAKYLEAVVTRWDEGETAIERARHYIAYVNRTNPESIVLETVQKTTYMHIDPSAVRALELVVGSRGGRKGTLLEILDRTITPMGRRKLFHRILRPFANLSDIENALDKVEFFTRQPEMLDAVRQALSGIKDLRRIAKRMIASQLKVTDLEHLRASLRKVSELAELKLGDWWSFPDFGDLLEKMVRILPEKIQDAGKGGGILIADGVDEEIDNIRSQLEQLNKTLLEYEKRLQKETGIAKLRIKYNDAFGYFIEVPRSQAKRVPSSFIRKQTLVNYERFTTPELTAIETRIKEYWVRLEERQKRLYEEFLNYLSEHAPKVDELAEIVADIDMTQSLAQVALEEGWTRPVFGNGDKLYIKNGRHPVVEKYIGSMNFIPNDTLLTRQQPMALITGPNMAGKSTYLRQVGIIVVLAQMGSFVPAECTELPVLDSIYARVGAADDIAFGKSTFMVEMSEVAKILKNATSRSLVLLDEIGRGTSTYDGISIAWATVEELVEREESPFGLVSTHYLELADFAKDHPKIKLLKVDVHEENGTVVFLHKVVEGVADKSYGLEVARLAGIPDKVIKRAEEVFGELVKRIEESAHRRRNRKTANIQTLPLFGGEHGED